MLTLSWRSVGSSSALAMALVVGLPALAEAQLFPNMWIQRKRNECVNEPPFYSHIRRNYFGYYPTCWRTFPEGWACPTPNPERPDREKAFRERKRDDTSKLEPPIDEEMPNGPGDRGNEPDGAPGMAPPNGGPRGNDPNLPPSPAGSPRSIFDLDNKRPAVPNAPAEDPFLTPGLGNPGGTLPGGVPPRAGAAAGANPLDPLGTPPRSSSNDSVSPPSTPSIDGPTAARARRAPARRSVASNPTAPATTTTEAGTPVLALPEISAPSAPDPNEAPQVATMPSSLPTNGAYIEIPTTATASNAIPTDGSATAYPAPGTGTTTQPAQAPTRRTSIIGSLFGLGNRTTR